MKFAFLVLIYVLTALSSFTYVLEPIALKEIYKSGEICFTTSIEISDYSYPDIILERPIDITNDEKGNVYVLDYRASDIKKLDKHGEILEIIGRPGRGPGDFHRPSLMTYSKGQLFVYDQGNQRLCGLTSKGEYIKSVNFSLMDGSIRKIDSLPHGDIVIEREKTYYEDPERPQKCILEIYSSELEYKKTVYSQDIWRNRFITTPKTTNIPQPYPSLVYWDISPDGKIIIGFSNEYKIEIYDPSKGRLYSFSHDYKPVKVTKDDKERFFSNLTSVSSEGIKINGAPEYIKKKISFPKYKPAFINILVDPEGNILVTKYRNEGQTHIHFDAFDSKGDFINEVKVRGDVPFPYLSSMMSFSNSYLWSVKLDQNGLANIIKYKIFFCKKITKEEK